MAGAPSPSIARSKYVSDSPSVRAVLPRHPRLGVVGEPADGPSSSRFVTSATKHLREHAPQVRAHGDPHARERAGSAAVIPALVRFAQHAAVGGRAHPDRVSVRYTSSCGWRKTRRVSGCRADPSCRTDAAGCYETDRLSSCRRRGVRTVPMGDVQLPRPGMRGAQYSLEHVSLALLAAPGRGRPAVGTDPDRHVRSDIGTR